MSQKNNIQRTYRFWATIYDLAHHLQTLWRDSNYRLMVAKAVNLQAGDKVLDISTGTGLTGLAELLEERKIYVIGIDITYAMLQKAQANINSIGLTQNFVLINGDIEQLPYADNSFDVILSTYGIGGIDNRDAAFKEIVRVAKPNARIAAIEMCTPPESEGLKRNIHNYFVHPWIKLFWSFRDTDLNGLFQRYTISISGTEYLEELIFGSSILVYGRINK